MVAARVVRLLIAWSDGPLCTCALCRCLHVCEYLCVSVCVCLFLYPMCLSVSMCLSASVCFCTTVSVCACLFLYPICLSVSVSACHAPAGLRRTVRIRSGSSGHGPVTAASPPSCGDVPDPSHPRRDPRAVTAVAATAGPLLPSRGRRFRVMGSAGP